MSEKDKRTVAAIIAAFTSPAESTLARQPTSLYAPRDDYVPRNLRPERKSAIAALIRYLDASPDLRIGQAVIGLFSSESDCWNAEDVDLIAAVATRKAKR
jgi:hypothetical protein